MKQGAWDVKYGPTVFNLFTILTDTMNGYPPAASYRSCRAGASMTIGQCIFPIFFFDPALGVEWRERDLSKVLPVDAMAL